jgi:SAM-dependent methyltransferase
MNWAYMRHCPWLDTRARFVAGIPRDGLLLDLGASDGETLGHMAELRPDLRLLAADMAGRPENYPSGCRFQRVNLERDPLDCPDQSLDAITCMQLLEHLSDRTVLLHEVARVLKPGGRVYFEMPHPRTLGLASPTGRAAGTFTLNFFDDPTHVRLVTAGALAQQLREAGLDVLGSGTSRNWMLAACWPLFFFLPSSRKRFTARVHWLGWSAYVVAQVSTRARSAESSSRQTPTGSLPN